MSDPKPDSAPESSLAAATGAVLPSPRRLLRSTIIAAVVALVLLVTVVMPAEHGIDPTGVGSLLGLTKMGEIKMSLEKESAASEQPEAGPSNRPERATAAMAAPVQALDPVTPSPATAPAEPAAMSDVTEIVLAPNEGKEIKLVMRKDARVTYSWSTDRGVVNYDTHADAPGIDYHGYGKGSGKKSDEGMLVAAFDGSHGWFWRNRGHETVTVTLTTNGEYVELKRL